MWSIEFLKSTYGSAECLTNMWLSSTDCGTGGWFGRRSSPCNCPEGAECKALLMPCFLLFWSLERHLPLDHPDWLANFTLCFDWSPTSPVSPFLAVWCLSCWYIPPAHAQCHSSMLWQVVSTHFHGMPKLTNQKEVVSVAVSISPLTMWFH